MIESSEQTGHRRMIASAPASAQSAFSLRCAAESGIKTIVQMGLCPGCSADPRSYPERSLRPFQNLSWKSISNSAPRQLPAPPAAKYWPVKFGDPDEKAHPVVNALSNACMQAAHMQNPGCFFGLTENPYPKGWLDEHRDAWDVLGLDQ